VIPATTQYVRAASLEEALAALADPNARPLAGGQSLLPVLKLRIAEAGLLVDIGRLELGGVTRADGTLRIGALVLWSDLVLAHELLRPALAAIAECAAGIGDIQVRNRGTLGGSLAHADPSSDMPAALLALGASLALRSRDGSRTFPLSDFFQGPYTTALEPGELITEIVVPVPEAGSGSAYEAIEHPASGFALAGAGALVRPDGTSTVALTGVGARPSVLPAGELDAGIAALEIYGDDFAPAGYRRHLVGVVARRALDRAGARTREDARWQG
jgi:aerobic carbon-monoxide dehydrogenase medium subunit